MRQAQLSGVLRYQDIFVNFPRWMDMPLKQIPEALIFLLGFSYPNALPPLLLHPTPELLPQSLTFPHCLLKLCGMEILIASDSVNISFLATWVT